MTIAWYPFLRCATNIYDSLLSENVERSHAMKKLQEGNKTLSKEMHRLKEYNKHFQSDSRS